MSTYLPTKFCICEHQPIAIKMRKAVNTFLLAMKGFVLGLSITLLLVTPLLIKLYGLSLDGYEVYAFVVICVSSFIAVPSAIVGSLIDVIFSLNYIFTAAILFIIVMSVFLGMMYYVFNIVNIAQFLLVDVQLNIMTAISIFIVASAFAINRRKKMPVKEE